MATKTGEPRTGRTAGAHPTRERILLATAELFRRQGYSATGMKQIVAAADAPFGSLYHFFPGGKEQLGAEVVRMAGSFFQELFATIARAAPDPLSAMHEYFAGAAQTLRDTNYEDACPIATVALETASTSETMRTATAEVFESWIEAGTRGFIASGLPGDTARELAISMIIALEGAFVLSRSMRTTEPLEVAGRAMVAELERALGQVRA